MATSQSTRAKRREQRRKQRARARRQDGNGQANKTDDTGRPAKSKLREWVDALVFAFIVMLIVRTLFFDLYRIPTPSMEKSLLVGDYLFVSKLHYGTRLPMGICVPFTDICVPGVEFPYIRLPGFSEMQRFDAVVFNWPVEDKLIDRKTHYIKRLIGMPGETLELRDKVVYVDGEPLPFLETMQQNWKVTKETPRVQLAGARLDALGAQQLYVERQYPAGLLGTSPEAYPNLALVRGTEEAAEQIEQWPYVTDVEPAVAAPDPYYSANLYPGGRAYTPDNFGPLTIPAAGMTVPLNETTWPVYEPVIRRFEEHAARRVAEGIYEIDGQPASTYTFEQDYFFMMGDNRDNSEDSRFWGFVPMDHIVGRAILIYFSKDPESFLLPRFDRLFKIIE